MKSINLLSLFFIAVLGIASFVDAVEVDGSANRLRNLGTGEKPNEKKPKGDNEGKDKDIPKGMGKKGSMGDGVGGPGVVAPKPKGGMMMMDKEPPKGKMPESDVPSYITSTVPSLAPV